MDSLYGNALFKCDLKFLIMVKMKKYLQLAGCILCYTIQISYAKEVFVNKQSLLR